MKFTIGSAFKISKILPLFRNLKLISGDVKFTLTSEGLKIQETDDAQVSLIAVFISKKWFSSYDEIQKDNDKVFGVNTEILNLIFTKSFKKEHNSIVFEYTDNSDKLDILLTESNGNQKNFKIPCMDINRDAFDIPSVEYAVDIKCRIKQFSSTINELLNYGDETKIICNDKKISLTVDGDLGHVVNDILNSDKNDTIVEYAIDDNTTTELTYSLKYMKLITDFSGFCEVVNLHFSKEYPMQLVYNLDYVMEDQKDGKKVYKIEEKDTNDITNYVKFYLAPKFED